MVEVNNKTRSRIDLTLVKRVVQKILKYYNIRKGEVSIAFVGDQIIRGLNKRYRGVDKVTDVLAFSGQESSFLGEVIINYAQVKRQAKHYSKSIKQELVFVLIHGLLHLLGYQDKTEKGRREMEELGKRFIGKLKNAK